MSRHRRRSALVNCPSARRRNFSKIRPRRHTPEALRMMHLTWRDARLINSLGVGNKAKRLTTQVAADLRCCNDRGPLCRFPARSGQMRREHQVWSLEDSRTRWRRFGIVDVERGGPQLAGIEGITECVLVEETAACGVDQHGTVRETGNLIAADQVAGLGRQSRMQAQYLGPRQEIVERYGRGANSRDICRVDIGIGYDHFCPERPQHMSNSAPNSTEAEESDRLSFQLRTGLRIGVEIPAPDAADEILVPLGQPSHRRQEQPDSVLGRGGGIASRGVTDGNTALGGG